MKTLRTAEYVSPKHPDKLCDRISDSLLNLYIEKDPNSRCAIETMGGHGNVIILGEVTSDANIPEQVIAETICGILESRDYKITISLHKQSPEIAKGVDHGGAGDQGVVIGYACDENEEMIPQEFYLAKSLCNYLYQYFPFDGKTQVTINNDFQVEYLVASFQNSKTEDLHKSIKDWIQKNDIKIAKNIVYFINPAGEWNIGGLDADTGLTGRKIIVDAYGPRVPAGGGAFSGKDWTKVDRSGAQYAQHIAQQLLQKHNADEVRVELAYAIGITEPVQKIAYIDSVPHPINEFDCSMRGIHTFIQNKNTV